jgi:hypothetical protein
MALAILDGTQTATTLSTILSSGQHITAHTVVSLGAQAITDMQSAVSGSVVSISNFPASQSTTFGAVTGSVSVLNFPASQAVTFTDASLTNTQLRASAVTVGGTVTVGNSLTVSSLPAISGTVDANITGGDLGVFVGDQNEWAEAIKAGFINWNDSILMNGGLNVAVAEALPSGSNRIGVVTASLSAGTAQIGSVTASISGTVPISISSVTVGNSVTIGSLPAISGTVTANTFALQGTAVTTSNFTSTTASTVLANYNATREVLTIFNEGAGNLHIAPGATCTTIAYQVRLSSGDYYEVPNHQTTITHSAVFATAGTARVTEVI